MLWFKIIKIREAEEESTQTTSDELLNGTKVLMKIVQLWIHTVRTSCEDQYFDAVVAPEELKRNGP